MITKKQLEEWDNRVKRSLYPDLNMDSTVVEINVAACEEQIEKLIKAVRVLSEGLEEIAKSKSLRNIILNNHGAIQFTRDTRARETLEKVYGEDE